MPYTITKIPDGDLNLGNVNGEFADLKPSSSDYATGGYPIIDGEQVVNNPSLNANVGMYKVVTAKLAGDGGGYQTQWDTTNKKLLILRQNSTTGPLAEVPASTDLSAINFRLLLIGL